ncbi:MAG: hypothetical protein HDKAJFGB_02387 [Anaerolineae bacterium]|nr:hypothetical protein [Anaerolineae bacterium]MDL1895784.1 hypothetical protein [Anaerolineae bacterium CFX7]RIK31002.1 MAG: hypothetical protein DCC52_05795 [Chloroflexota bacterium]
MVRPQINNQPLSYSEILRVIGRYLDTHNIIEPRIIETDDGLIVQGIIGSGARFGERETYQLTAEDIVDLRKDATAQRGARVQI